jgi:lipoprotein-anchoring transpeptidase ErfK/SrfK
VSAFTLIAGFHPAAPRAVLISRALRTGELRVMGLVLRRTALFVVVIMIWALLAAAVARAQQSPNVYRPVEAKLEPPAAAQPQPPPVPQSPSIVPFSGYRAGTIVVRTNDRRLYCVMKGDKALELPVGVGKEGWRWFGRAAVEATYIKPSWQAPPELHRGTYGAVIPGGAPNNPMGVAALTLRKGEYAIHGTNNPKSVGGFVSHGCIRMYNKDITRLFAMVSVGTPVVVEK